jgi:hypothetical protein
MATRVPFAGAEGELADREIVGKTWAQLRSIAWQINFHYEISCRHGAGEA